MEPPALSQDQTRNPLDQLPVPPGKLAYGCWRLAGTWNAAAIDDERRKQAETAVMTAIDAGFTVFDHADIYCDGEAEQLFGDTLKKQPSLREKIILASKCGIRFAGKPDPQSPYRYDFSKDHIIRSCEGSLKRLGTDHLDILMLHRPDFLGHPYEVAEAVGHLQSRGMIRLFGASNFSLSQIEMYHRAGVKIAVHQIEISLVAHQAVSDGRLDQCIQHHITPMAWSPLSRGFLGDGLRPDFEHQTSETGSSLLETMDEIAGEIETNRSGLALAWLLKHPAGIMPVIGSIHPERIRKAMQASRIELSRDHWYRLTEAALGSRLP
jgi:predicted oxidoreductase